jgi:hypothetical protein
MHGEGYDMINRRMAALGVGFVAALTLGLAGCGGDDGDGGGPGGTEPTKDPAVELRESVDKLNQTSAKVTMTAGPLTGSGVVDAPNKQGNVKLKVSAGGQTINVETLAVGGDMWLKMTGVPNVPDKWLHIDPSKVSPDAGLGINAGELDLVGGDKLFQGIATVERTGEGQYKGTLDLTKATGSSFADEETLKQLGDRAKAVPFEAALDDEGRLTKFMMDLGQVAGQTLKLDAAYSDFGTDVNLEAPPAAEVIEAPEEIYQLLNA